MRSLIRKLLLVLAPLMVLAGLYLFFDPFEVVHRYDRHYNDPRIIYNWDYNQTETLLRNYPQYRFDSFILGSSRSKVFLAEDWQRHIDSGHILHYAAMAETLFGVERKVALLDRQGVPIRNCLLVVDRGLLSATWNSTGHLFIKHPSVSGQSVVEFHLTFFRAFCNPTFLYSYLATKGGLPRRFIPRQVILEEKETRYDPVMGDLSVLNAEKELERDPAAFYRRRASIFFRRPEKVSVAPAVIGEEQRLLLGRMADVFRRHQTNVKVVISPLYDQAVLNPGDLEVLRRLFGKENIHDFSGINRFTTDIHNYFETSHYRPHVARAILDAVYRAPSGSP